MSLLREQQTQLFNSPYESHLGHADTQWCNRYWTVRRIRRRHSKNKSINICHNNSCDDTSVQNSDIYKAPCNHCP